MPSRSKFSECLGTLYFWARPPQRAVTGEKESMRNPSEMLTDRDLAVLLVLDRYYVLSRPQIQRLCFPTDVTGRVTRSSIPTGSRPAASTTPRRRAASC